MSLSEWIRDLIGFNWVNGGNSYFVNKLVTGGESTTYDPETETLTLAEAGSGGTGSITASYSTEMGVLEVPGITNIRAGTNVSFAFPVAGICQVNATAPAIDPAAIVQSSGVGRRVEQYGTVALTASGRTFAFDLSPAIDVKAKTEINATIVGGTGLLNLSAALAGDRLLVNVTFAAGDRLLVKNQSGVTFVDETATAAGSRSYSFVYTTGWELWRPAGSTLVNGVPCYALATGSDFPLSIASGVATLDPNRLIARSLWRDTGSLDSFAITTDSATACVTPISGVSLSSVALERSTIYAAIVSARILINRTSAPGTFAFIDIVSTLTITVDQWGSVNFSHDASADTVSVTGAAELAPASASVTCASVWSFQFNVQRPPGIACNFIRADTAILELQEIA